MCLSFMVQSCSWMKCAMLFSGHFNAHLSRELGCAVCLIDMDGCASHWNCRVLCVTLCLLGQYFGDLP